MKIMKLITLLLLILPIQTFADSALPSPFLNENIDSHAGSKTQVKFKYKKKNKWETLAEAELKYGDGKVQLVFDSTKLNPGQYEVLLTKSCDSKNKNQWVLGQFKTQSGHISTEFVLNHSEDKWSFEDGSEKQALLVRRLEKKNGKTTTISCTEFNLKANEPVMAAEEF